MTITIHHWRTPADLASWRITELPDGRRMFHSPPAALPLDCTEIVPSWSVYTPPGTAVEIQLRVCYGARWTKAYRLARWDSALVGSQRTSFDAQRDDDGSVCTDTLLLRPGANAVEASVICMGTDRTQPHLRGCTLACSGDDQDDQQISPTANATIEPQSTQSPQSHQSSALRTLRALRLDTAPRTWQEPTSCCLETPCFSQFTYAAQDGWCSPTSLAMVLGYWYERTGWPTLAPFVAPDVVPALVAPSVYDPHYGGYGNWSFNVAFAATFGLESYVARMSSLAEIEPWLAAGVPVALTIAWSEGQLTGAPLPRSRGHLLVATGITPAGDLLVADPAGANRAEVRRCYLRAEVEACWLRPHGTAYLIHPPAWATPAGLGNIRRYMGKKLLAESTSL